MCYVIAIAPGDGRTAFGVVVPDLPGCYSAGDTLDEAMTNAQEAIVGWIDAALDQGGAIPKPMDVESIRRNPEYAGWLLAVVSVDMSQLDDTTERVNSTISRRILARLDALAKKAHESRSGYIARYVATAP
jgi:predicted RNase H-like HicB family nuclease